MSLCCNVKNIIKINYSHFVLCQPQTFLHFSSKLKSSNKELESVVQYRRVHKGTIYDAIEKTKRLILEISRTQFQEFYFPNYFFFPLSIFS